MTPKNIHKIFIPPKKFFFLKTPKNIEIQNYEPHKIAQAFVCSMHENISLSILGCSSFQHRSQQIHRRTSTAVRWMDVSLPLSETINYSPFKGHLCAHSSIFDFCNDHTKYIGWFDRIDDVGLQIVIARHSLNLAFI